MGLKMGRPSKRPPKEVLYWLYWERRLSMNWIAKAFRVSREAVRLWLNQYGIPTRDRVEAVKTRGKRKRINLTDLRKEIKEYEIKEYERRLTK